MSHVSNFTAGKLCQGEVLLDAQSNVFTVKGTCRVPGLTSIRYLASAPADYRQSRAGSALPYPNEAIAYDNTPNSGSALLTNGQFQFQVLSPNSYYMNNGSSLVQPHVHMVFGENNVFNLMLSGPVPNRSLKSLPGRQDRSTHR